MMRRENENMELQKEACFLQTRREIRNITYVFHV